MKPIQTPRHLCFPSDRFVPLFYPIPLEASNPLMHAELAVDEQ